VSITSVGRSKRLARIKVSARDRVALSQAKGPVTTAFKVISNRRGRAVRQKWRRYRRCVTIGCVPYDRGACVGVLNRDICPKMSRFKRNFRGPENSAYLPRFAVCTQQVGGLSTGPAIRPPQYAQAQSPRLRSSRQRQLRDSVVLRARQKK